MPTVLHIYVTGSEIGLWHWWDGLCMVVRDDRLGMLMDVQACWCAHVQRFFPPEGEADDHDIIRWHHCLYAYIGVGGYISEHTWGSGLSSGFLVVLHFSFTLWGATDPLLQLPWCLSRSEITTLQGSVLYLFDCKCPRLFWVPWVSLLQLLAS